jgi:hypothetical protein
LPISLLDSPLEINQVRWNPIVSQCSGEQYKVFRYDILLLEPSPSHLGVEYDLRRRCGRSHSNFHKTCTAGPVNRCFRDI